MIKVSFHQWKKKQLNCCLRIILFVRQYLRGKARNKEETKYCCIFITLSFISPVVYGEEKYGEGDETETKF